MRTLVGLLKRMRSPHMDFQTILLRKLLPTMRALVFRIVCVLVIDNQTLLLHWNLLLAAIHPTAPGVAYNRVRKHVMLTIKYGSARIQFFPRYNSIVEDASKVSRASSARCIINNTGRRQRSSKGCSERGEKHGEK